MLYTCLNQTDYLVRREAQFQDLSESEQERYLAQYDKLGVERMENLQDDVLIEFLVSLYSDCGSPARDPKNLFYSFYLFVNSDYLSLDKWVKDLYVDPVLRMLIGLKADEKPPSIGTHYNFVTRMTVEVEETSHIQLKNRNNRKPKQPKSNEKADNPNEKLSSADLKDMILNDENCANKDAQIFTNILYQLGILPSIECGLITEDEVLLSGDGTNLPVKSDPNGHRREGLDENLRYYGAPDADWGWDSSKHCHFFGYNLYLFTSVNKALISELPIGFDLFGASEHDATASLKAFSGFLNTAPTLSVSGILLDSAHDNNATYQLCHELEIEPFIDINSRAKKPAGERGMEFTELGVPVCENGLEMKFDGYSPTREDCKWLCPLKNGEKCAKACYNNSSIRTFYTRPKDNPRFFTKTPRNSQQFKLKYNSRTASERMNKRILKDHNVENRSFKSRKMILFSAALASIDIHMQAQLEAKKVA